MTEEDVLKTENLALKREVARLHKVIEVLNSHFLESVHAEAGLFVDIN